jgi:hypothetical protein
MEPNSDIAIASPKRDQPRADKKNLPQRRQPEKYPPLAA